MDKRDFVERFVAGYGRFILDNRDHPWARWTRRMIHVESYHQMMAALFVHESDVFKGWQVLTEVDWGGRHRTDLVFVPPGHDVGEDLDKGTRKVEVKVIVASDWSDRWAYACSDLLPSTNGKKKCDFLLAVVIDDLKERPRKRRYRAKDQFDSLAALDPCECLQTPKHFPDVKGTRRAARRGVKLLARWPLGQPGHAEVDFTSKVLTISSPRTRKLRVMVCALTARDRE